MQVNEKIAIWRDAPYDDANDLPAYDRDSAIWELELLQGIYDEGLSNEFSIALENLNGEDTWMTLIAGPRMLAMALEVVLDDILWDKTRNHPDMFRVIRSLE